MLRHRPTDPCLTPTRSTDLTRLLVKGNGGFNPVCDKEVVDWYHAVANHLSMGREGVPEGLFPVQNKVGQLCRKYRQL